MAAVGELIVFVNGYKTLVDAGVAPPLMTGPVSNISGQEPVSAELEARRASFLSSLERQRDALVAQANVVPDPIQVVAAVAKDEPIPAVQPTGIVGQIDDILQKHIRAEPKLEGRSIHLEQAPAGGLRIKVDDQVYQRPAEIEEKEIQLVIKMALKEWEAN
jgi:hypothetical protein